MKKKELINFNLSAVFIAIGLILPFLTGQIQQIGSMLLPMHIPVLLCGLICGWKYGLFVGFILPPLRSAIFGMPPMFPTAIAMAFELATYGVVVGFLYQRSIKKSISSIYLSMIGAMISGRIVWGIVMMLILRIRESIFTWRMFITGAFLNAIPGIILQLVLIPSIMVILYRTKMIPLSEKVKAEPENKKN
ncbi:ECF transporter S component [Petrotoga sp. 9PWA.NaAc.5.4]|uniref:ECF transporter S component n=1 Tax=Petrotoga sp. 9PWA.NaAc.5.4 TaxID=1434328 RepID=UPI000CC693F5|nr:ECF transporter S component [Petrotoga sp. 9PWA.NaAc.5.4]PNR93699.1 membrane protein [Petrotoga sp. 9PWA.NaAc.5.4]